MTAITRDQLIVKAQMLDDEIAELIDQTHRLSVKGRELKLRRAAVAHQLADAPAELLPYKDV